MAQVISKKKSKLPLFSQTVVVNYQLILHGLHNKQKGGMVSGTFLQEWEEWCQVPFFGRPLLRVVNVSLNRFTIFPTHPIPPNGTPLATDTLSWVKSTSLSG